MKRFLAVLLSILLVLTVTVSAVVGLLAWLFSLEDPVLESLPDYLDKEYYTCGGFQDYTDYAKYTYRITDADFNGNPYFQPVTAETIPRLLTYLEDFEEWVTCPDFPAGAYDFDKSLIKEGDYFCIVNQYTEPEREFANYNVYYFSLETQTLYYFHNNI